MLATLAARVAARRPPPAGRTVCLPESVTFSATVIPLAPAAMAATPSVSSSTAATTPPCTRDGEPLCAAVNVHRARTSTDRGTLPGGGSVGRSIHSTGGAWGLRRPEPACTMLSTRPSGWRTRKRASSRRRARSRSVIAAMSSAARGAFVSVDVRHDHRLDELADARRRANDASGIDAGSGKLVTEKLGEPRRRRRGLGGLHRRPGL